MYHVYTCETSKIFSVHTIVNLKVK
jgi:hypothetical protein